MVHPADAHMRDRRRTLLFDQLPEDALLHVLAHLRLPDVHNLRLATAGKLLPATAAHLRVEMLDRVRALEHLWTLMDLAHVHETFSGMLPSGWEIVHPGGGAANKFVPLSRARAPVALGRYLQGGPVVAPATVRGAPRAQFPLCPTDVLAKADYITLREIDICGATSLAREFPTLETLWIFRDARVHDVIPSNPRAPMSDRVFAQLGRLTRLKTLLLDGQNLTKLPETLLGGMSELQELGIANNPGLTALPSQLASWLPNICSIDMTNMRFESIPRSLVITLVANSRENRGDDGFMASPTMPRETWERELSVQRFPEAVHAFGDAPLQRWWDGTLVHVYDWSTDG